MKSFQMPIKFTIVSCILFPMISWNLCDRKHTVTAKQVPVLQMVITLVERVTSKHAHKNEHAMEIGLSCWCDRSLKIWFTCMLFVQLIHMHASKLEQREMLWTGCRRCIAVYYCHTQQVFSSCRLLLCETAGTEAAEVEILCDESSFWSNIFLFAQGCDVETLRLSPVYGHKTWCKGL